MTLRRCVLPAIVCMSTLACAGGGGGTADDDDTGGDTDDGGDGGDGGGDSGAFPVGFAVASPLSQGSGGMGPAPASRRGADGIGRQGQALTNLSPGKSFAQKQEELSAILAGTTAEDCALVLPHALFGFSPLCYGPSLDYQNHPDSVDGTQDGRLPSGDIGIWEETQGSSEPCAAAKLSSLINNVGDRVDYGLYMAASMVCLMNVNGVALPDEGSSQDLTELVAVSIAANNPGFTVNEASVARLADDAGQAVYAYGVNIDVPDTSPQGEQILTVDTVLEHASDPAAPDRYHGTMRGTRSGIMDPYAGQHDGDAYSVTYERSDEHLRYALLDAWFAAESEVVFDETGRIDVGGDWTGNMNQGIFDLDADTGTLGNVSFAWQAGRGDSHTRVFNVSVAGDETEKSGCGFFGYGPRFDPDTGTTTDNSISTFICNWAGPGGEHAGRAGSAQKQCFQSLSGGPLEVTDSRITYGPVNDCDTTDDPDFAYKVVDDDTYSTDPIAVDLVELASDPDYAAYAVPVAPAGF